MVGDESLFDMKRRQDMAKSEVRSQILVSLYE